MDFQEKTEERYRGECGRAYHENKRGIPDCAYSWIAEVRAEKLGRYVGPSDTVLEYGVGTGWNLALLSCKRKVGYDLAEHLEGVVCGHGIEFVRDFGAVEAGSADVVICHHVLEHTANPAEALEKAGRPLRAGGRLLVFVPYEKERRYRRYDAREPNHHVYSWNVQTLGNMVCDCGFLVEEGGVFGYGYDRFAAVWAVRLGLGRRCFRLIRRMAQVAAPLLEVRIAARKK